MTHPVSTTYTNHAEVQQPAPPPPHPPTRIQKSGELSSDTVTLKSAGDVDHDGDNR